MKFIHLVPLNNQIRCIKCGIVVAHINRLKEHIANDEDELKRKIQDYDVCACVPMIKDGVK